MKAIGTHIVIKEAEQVVKETKGGLLLTQKQTNDIRYIEGDVITPGTHVQLIKAGDRILYDMAAGHGLEVDGKFYKVIQERDVVLVL